MEDTGIDKGGGEMEIMSLEECQSVVVPFSFVSLIDCRILDGSKHCRV